MLNMLNYLHVLTSPCIQCNAMQCNAMQCNAMQCNAMQCNAMQCNAMQCIMVSEGDLGLMTKFKLICNYWIWGSYVVKQVKVLKCIVF